MPGYPLGQGGKVHAGGPRPARVPFDLMSKLGRLVYGNGSCVANDDDDDGDVERSAFVRCVPPVLV